MGLVLTGCGDTTAAPTTTTAAPITTTAAPSTTTAAAPVTTLDVSALGLSDLVGSWTASSVLYVSATDATQQFDVVADGGEMRMTVLDRGAVRTWFVHGDLDDEWDAQFSMFQATLTARPAEASRPTRHFTFTLDGDTLTLVDLEATFDFTMLGGDQTPAVETITFIKQN